MEFEFRWAIDEDFSNRKIPIIWLYRPDESRPKMFFEFLDDKGGMRYNVYISDFIILRNKIRDSKYDDSIDKSFCTESWCAVVSGDVTNISFAYNESHNENMDTEIFYKVLCEWIDFVQQGPGQDGDSPIKKFTV